MPGLTLRFADQEFLLTYLWKQILPGAVPTCLGENFRQNWAEAGHAFRD
jgi:hypothetical protein